MKAPNRLDFTPEEIDSLVYRLENKCLEDGDYALLTEILRAMIWLSFSLKEKELSISRLRKIFGIKTESAKKLLEYVNQDTSQQPNADEQSDAENKKALEDGKRTNPNSEKPKNNKGKSHGHRPSSDYSEAIPKHTQNLFFWL